MRNNSIGFYCVLLAFCLQRKATEIKAANFSEPRRKSVSEATPNVPFSSPKNGNYNGKGVVTKINLDLVSVELDHEEIKGLMPKMTMEFYVKKNLNWKN